MHQTVVADFRFTVARLYNGRKLNGIGYRQGTKKEARFQACCFNRSSIVGWCRGPLLSTVFFSKKNNSRS